MTIYNLRITCETESDEGRGPLAVGTKVVAYVGEDTLGAGTPLLVVEVPVTEANRHEDPEILAGVALEAHGWRVTDCGPEWISTGGNVETYGGTMIELGKGWITDYDARERGLPEGATGVYWVGHDWTECRLHVASDEWRATVDVYGECGKLLYDDTVDCDACREAAAEPGCAR